ncbi:MAG TPA: LLM class flavin-dependent oxidoreductase [Xanthobacteraceae bacterium]|nr:LLM class flavin-dependent oxidoreductase [Xanthobacteraceae bacterium]
MADLPKLSVRFSGGLAARRCVELAKVADATGYDSIWFAENPFSRGVLPAASACAAATSRVRIGIGVFNPYNRHPTLIAMEIGALDELAQGRARLGIGSGIASATERMGLGTERPLAAVRDAIIIVRGLIKGDEVSYAGRAFSAHAVKLEYRAPRPDMPLLMAARGEQALALCGRIADGLMISNMCPPDFTRHAVGIVHNSAREAGRALPAEIVQYVPCAARPDRHEAFGLAQEAIAEMLPGFWSLSQRVPSAKAALLRAANLAEADFAAAVETLRAGGQPADALDARFVVAFAIAGTADDCLAQARRYRAAGASELALTFVGPRPDEDMAYLARDYTPANQL